MSELWVAGVDEVGRGCLAGPVFAGAVILNPDFPFEGLKDSKKLTPRQRELWANKIQSHAIAWALGSASLEEIDRINILQATLLAMERAVKALPIKPHHILVDGNRLPAWDYSSEAIIRGDEKIPAISAASILAKVSRDAYMREMEQIYPGYGFEKHVGYGTLQHLKALQEKGPCALHRRSFSPIKKGLYY